MSKYTPFSDGYGYGWSTVRSKKLQEVIRESSATIAALKKKLKFQALAFSGSSGACVAFHAGIEHNIPFIYVRKTGEKSHGKKIESNLTGIARKYLIVDDFVASGNTVKHIITGIQEYAVKRQTYIPKCAGLFCFVELPGKSYTREFAEGKTLFSLKSYTRENMIDGYDDE
jgi:adenine/guanine phosphoribosyltransferase-like PRPP-binding protein